MRHVIIKRDVNRLTGKQANYLTIITNHNDKQTLV